MWPLLIPLITTGISAASNYFGGRQQRQAAEQSSEQLQQGVRDARAYAEPLYANAQRLALEQFQQGQAALAPYAQQGGQGLTALTALLGLPGLPPAAPASATTPPPEVMGHLTGGGKASAILAARSGLVNGRGVPLSMLDGLTTKQIGEANRATGGAFLGGGAPGATPASQSSYVRLRAPTGEERPVPADQVGFYLARGATRV